MAKTDSGVGGGAARNATIAPIAGVQGAESRPTALVPSYPVVVPQRTLRDFIKAIALDIGESVAHHIEIMYPAAKEATPITFLLSVKNHTYNEIMAAAAVDNAFTMMAQLAFNKAHRRAVKAAYRKIRKQQKAEEGQRVTP